MVTTNSTLEPRSLVDILSETFKIYWRNFLGLIAIVVIPEVVSGALVFILLPYALASLSLSIVMMLILLLVYALMGGVLIYAVSEQSLGQTVNIGRAYSFVWERLGAIIGAQILAALALILMSITIIGIPFAIYFWVRWAFIVQVILLDGADSRAALSRSSDLVRNNWWRVAGIIGMVGIIAGAIGFTLNFTVGLIPYAGSIIASILPTPIFITAATLLYYDLRVRQEGYNLETMADELGIANKPSHRGIGPIIE